MSVESPTATATRNARDVAMNPPTYGMNPANSASTASGSANGSPSRTMMTHWLAAPNAEIAAVPSM